MRVSGEIQAVGFAGLFDGFDIYINCLTLGC